MTAVTPRDVTTQRYTGTIGEVLDSWSLATTGTDPSSLTERRAGDRMHSMLHAIGALLMDIASGAKKLEDVYPELCMITGTDAVDPDDDEDDVEVMIATLDGDRKLGVCRNCDKRCGMNSLGELRHYGTGKCECEPNDVRQHQAAQEDADASIDIPLRATPRPIGFAGLTEQCVNCGKPITRGNHRTQWRHPHIDPGNPRYCLARDVNAYHHEPTDDPVEDKMADAMKIIAEGEGPDDGRTRRTTGVYYAIKTLEELHNALIALADASMIGNNSVLEEALDGVLAFVGRRA